MKAVKMRSMDRPNSSSARQGTAQWTCGKGAVQAKRKRELLEHNRVSLSGCGEEGGTHMGERMAPK